MTLTGAAAGVVVSLGHPNPYQGDRLEEVERGEARRCVPPPRYLPEDSPEALPHKREGVTGAHSPIIFAC